MIDRVRATSQRRAKHRLGITLVELLVAVLITLVILLVMIRAFKTASNEISKGRASMEMASQLRSAGETMRSDLENVTVPLRPWAINAESDGYFEYVEGLDTDNFEVVSGVNQAIAGNISDPVVAGASYLGDRDDILAMTVRSKGRPYRGRWVNPATGFAETVESYVAEIVWWTIHEDIDPDGPGPLGPDGEVQYSENIKLYRRVLLIRPDLTTTYTNMNDYYADNDVAARPTSAGGISMNSLADLSKRENRFAHNGNLGNFPHEIMRGVLNVRNLVDEHEGLDVMLTNVAAFDVKVFSPNAEVQLSAGQTIDPSDPGFGAIGTGTDEGAYVDLGTADNAAGDAWFFGDPDVNSQLDQTNLETTLGRTFPGRTWCTWSPHYEHDGINQDFNDDALVDQGTDGVDNDGINGADDDEERETKPPYEHPIRSLQVQFRLIEKNSGQTRQLTVRQSFVPE